jgi:predicted dehydrogenase
MSERVKVAVIGVGMGKAHAEYYQRCPEAELVALCDRDANRLAEVAGILGVSQTFTDAEELFRLPGLQAVSVALPNFLHAPVTIAALNAGLHVLCEKPLAMNATEAAEMVAAAHRAGRRLMVHFNTRFNETSQLVKQAVDNGELGDIYFARALWHRSRGIPGMGGWFTQKQLAGGGALIDIGVHRIDLVLWLMGFPRVRSVSSSTYRHLGQQLAHRQGKEFDVEDLAAGFIRFENGASLTFEISWASQAEKREDMCTHLMGMAGGAIIRNLDEGYHMEARLLKDVGGALVEAAPMTHLPGLETAQAHFVHCIQQGRETMAPGEHGLAVMRVLDAIYESARTGREVLLNGN